MRTTSLLEEADDRNEGEHSEEIISLTYCWYCTSQGWAPLAQPCGHIKFKDIMLYYALVFLLVAIVAGAVGFYALAGTAALIAKILFVVFLVLFIVGLFSGRRPRV